MCCVLSTLLFFGPRLGILVWWLINQHIWARAYDNFIIPLLGFFFLPWTTLAYVYVFQEGISGFEWILLGVAVLADLAGYGGGFRNRGRVRGRG